MDYISLTFAGKNQLRYQQAPIVHNAARTQAKQNLFFGSDTLSLSLASKKAAAKRTLSAKNLVKFSGDAEIAKFKEDIEEHFQNDEAKTFFKNFADTNTSLRHQADDETQKSIIADVLALSAYAPYFTGSATCEEALQKILDKHHDKLFPLFADDTPEEELPNRYKR